MQSQYTGFNDSSTKKYIQYDNNSKNINNVYNNKNKNKDVDRVSMKYINSMGQI